MSYSTGPSASVAEIAALVERRPEGFSLEAPFYTSQEVYDLDMDAIFGGHWLFCRHRGRGARAGRLRHRRDRGLLDHHRARRRRGRPRAAQRVPAPGSRLLEDPCGAVGNLVCPYHQWTYRTDGSLIFAESPAARASTSRQFGLKQVHVRTLAGLIFVCLAEEPPTDFDEVAAVVEPYLTPYRLQRCQGRPPDRPDRGGELEAGDGEQPRVPPLRRLPPGAPHDVLPVPPLLRGGRHPADAPGVRALPGRVRAPGQRLHDQQAPPRHESRARQPPERLHDHAAAAGRRRCVLQ